MYNVHCDNSEKHWHGFKSVEISFMERKRIGRGFATGKFEEPEKDADLL